MPYEDKVIRRNPPAKTLLPESPCSSQSICLTSNMQPTGSPIQHGPVAILWDIENCPVPVDIRPEDIAGNIRMALRMHPIVNGAVTLFSAYGDFNAFPRRLREGYLRTGVKLVDVPNGRKDAADKAILVDMFLFALDNRPPSSIVLISGDVDFAPALHILGQHGYTVILTIPCAAGVSSALTNAGRFVWDWPTVARGEGYVSPHPYIPTSCNYEDGPIEEETIVYRGRSQIYCYNSVQEYEVSNVTPVPQMSSSQSESLPCGLNEVPKQDWWVQPGDIQGLKEQLVRICEMSGGTMPLLRVPAEYIKNYGCPLYVAEYGTNKLVNLMKKMTDTFIVTGKGTKRKLSLRNNSDGQTKKYLSPKDSMTKDQEGKEIVEDSVDINICPNMASSSDDFSNDDRNGDIDNRFASFRNEVQELLVCYAYIPVPLSVFESLYKQRYKRNFESFGVEGFEELMEKLKDVVVLCEDLGSSNKFLHLVINV